MGLLRVGYRLLYPSEPAETYKDKRGPTPRSSTSEDETLPLFRPKRYRGFFFGGLRNVRRRQSGLLVACVLLAIVTLCWKAQRDSAKRSQSFQCTFPPGNDVEPRHHDAEDTFSKFRHRGVDCEIPSLDLHRPFGPVCPDKGSVLKAMSDGGRVGKDAPYVPRGCDMRWYNTEEVCEILNRFSQVVLVGDSMLRHITGALNVLIREDLGRQCFCYNQFNVQSCSVQGIYSTMDVLEHDRLSLRCPTLVNGWQMELRMEQIVRYPIPDDELSRLEKALMSDTTRPRAFILGHGLWNNLELSHSEAWLDSVLAPIRLALEHRSGRHGRTRDGQLPILLVTPNAAGDKKPNEWLITQGNKALVGFENAMAVEAAKRRIDHLGTWNMSIQATLYDGVHMDLRGNLVKAMMVLNWLDRLEFQ